MKSKGIDIYRVIELSTYAVLGLFIYDSYNRITQYQNTDTLIAGGISFVAWIMIFIVFISGVVLLSKIVHNRLDYIILWGFVYLLFAVISTSLFGGFSIYNLAFRCVEMGYWICVFNLFYYHVRHSKKITTYYTVYTYAFVVLLLCFIVEAISKTNRTLLLNPVYYLMFAFPLILLNKRRIIRYVFLGLLFIAIIMSYKRSAMISYIMATIIYLFYDAKINKISNKKTWKVILGSVILAYVGYYIYLKLTIRLDLDWISRMEALRHDGGSGRADIWKNVISYFFSNNPFNWIFGYGYRSSYFLGAAHNDLLEILFDFGFLGLFSYIVFLICIGKCFFKMKRENYANYPAFAFSLVVFLMGTLFSQVVIYPYWFIGMVIFWGITIADFKNSRKGEKVENIMAL